MSICCVLPPHAERKGSLLIPPESRSDCSVLPLLQGVCDLFWWLQSLNVDLTAAFSPFLQEVRNLLWCLQNLDLTAGFSPPAERTWCLLILPEWGSDFRRGMSPFLQYVSDVVGCLHNVYLTAAFSPSCRRCVISHLMSAECRSQYCRILPLLQTVREVSLIFAECLSQCYRFLSLLKNVRDVVWYLQIVNLTAALSPLLQTVRDVI